MGRGPPITYRPRAPPRGRTSPKSATLIVHGEVSSKLRVARSRCTNPRAPRYAMAPANCRRKRQSRATGSGGVGAGAVRRACREPSGASSITCGARRLMSGGLAPRGSGHPPSSLTSARDYPGSHGQVCSPSEEAGPTRAHADVVNVGAPSSS